MIVRGGASVKPVRMFAGIKPKNDTFAGEEGKVSVHRAEADAWHLFPHSRKDPVGIGMAGCAAQNFQKELALSASFLHFPTSKLKTITITVFSIQYKKHFVKCFFENFFMGFYEFI